MNKKDISSCIECDCYDEDFGCTMPSVDKSYACPLNLPVDEKYKYCPNCGQRIEEL